MKKSFLASGIFMIKPQHFAFNEETSANNAFQQKSTLSHQETAQKAIAEFDSMVSKLRKEGINVVVFEDAKDRVLPDAVFPNNWISTHFEGTIITYPMFAPNRRKERREDIVQYLESHYNVQRRYSLEMFEDEGQFLEGTGSMVFDHEYKIIYACLSPRTDVQVLNKISLLLNYEVSYFFAKDKNGMDIYHTNVLMAMGQDFVICCMDAIQPDQRESLTKQFEATNKEIIELSFEQMNSFAGNMLQLMNSHGEPVLVMSKTAFDSLTAEQRHRLMLKTKLLDVDIHTIETIGGGSARCMMAELYLSN
ncbi:MAG TPA: arginine deiminase-related protein [Saprospiraceae bacterium]|nr:arginine deiminase-related protein [Saprospiraceae bacterium]